MFCFKFAIEILHSTKSSLKICVDVPVLKQVNLSMLNRLGGKKPINRASVLFVEEMDIYTDLHYMYCPRTYRKLHWFWWPRQWLLICVIPSLVQLLSKNSFYFQILKPNIKTASFGWNYQDYERELLSNIVNLIVNNLDKGTMTNI